MSIVNQEKFVDALLSTTNSQLYQEISYNIDGGRKNCNPNQYWESSPSFPYPVNREACITLLNQIRDYVVARGYLNSKMLRPWEVADIYSDLDRSEPWLGFEFETGYVSHAARSDVIAYTWDNFDNVCFDWEGEGASPVEITFAPAEVSKFDNKTADAYQFMKYLSDNKKLVERTEYNDVGTHVNISHPELNSENSGAASAFLNNTIRKLGEDHHNFGELFGREHLYGGFFGRFGNKATWLEGKLFRTTYDIEQFDNYVRVSKALVAVLDAYLTSDTNRTYGDTCTNFMDVLDKGEVPVISAIVGWRGYDDEINYAYNDYDDDDYYFDDETEED